MVLIAKTLVKSPPDSLPSNTKVSPRESLNTVTLRSGRELTSALGQQCEKASPKPKVVIVKGTSIGGNVEQSEREQIKDETKIPSLQPIYLIRLS